MSGMTSDPFGPRDHDGSPIDPELAAEAAEERLADERRRLVEGLGRGPGRAFDGHRVGRGVPAWMAARSTTAPAAARRSGSA